MPPLYSDIGMRQAGGLGRRVAADARDPCQRPRNRVSRGRRRDAPAGNVVGVAFTERGRGRSGTAKAECRLTKRPAVLDAIRNDRCAAVYRIVLTAKLRPGEALALQCADLDLAHPTACTLARSASTSVAKGGGNRDDGVPLHVSHAGSPAFINLRLDVRRMTLMLP